MAAFSQKIGGEGWGEEVVLARCLLRKPLIRPIEQIALFVFASNKVNATLAGGRVMLIPELLQQIFVTLKGKTVAKAAVPEQFPLIRTLQMVSDYRNALLPSMY